MNISDTNNDGIAIDGFDPVAYYNGDPLRGNPNYAYTIGQMTFHFATPENRSLFEKTPAKYIPLAGSFVQSTRVAPPDVQQPDNDKYIGNKTLAGRTNLQDTPISMENNVPIDLKEDGDIEMQNLSDSSK